MQQRVAIESTKWMERAELYYDTGHKAKDGTCVVAFLVLARPPLRRFNATKTV
jgi:hypothetical protein